MVYVNMLSNNITREFLQKFKSCERVPLVCFVCGGDFLRPKNDLLNSLSLGRNIVCQRLCGYNHWLLATNRGKDHCVCQVCGTEYVRSRSQVARTPNKFCSKSCSVTWQNKHKTTGYRRSKLEKYLEEKIRKEFPALQFEANCRSVIDYELDFYFPTLKFAIEVNGITHYRPVYSEARFKRTKEIDAEKKLRCSELGITLYVIPNTIHAFTAEFGDITWSEMLDSAVSPLRPT